MVDAIYVGNLEKSVTEDELRELFTPFGTVLTSTIIRDKADSKSKGFGFVKLDNKKIMKVAAKELNKTRLKGKQLKVSCAIEGKS